MDPVKICIIWTIWKGNHVVTKLKLEVLLKALVTLNAQHLIQMAKAIQERLKYQLFPGRK